MGILAPALTGAARIVNLTANATTNTTKLQAALDAGGHIYVRNSGQVNDTLLIGDDTTLELGPGVTITLAAASDCNMLRNADTVNGNSNITIQGGTWDYNQANQSPADPHDLHAIVLQNVTNLTLANIHGVNASKYVFLIADAENVTAHDLTFDTPSDGLHFQGPLTNADIRNLSGTTGDDLLAFTAGDYADYELTAGNFTNVYVAHISGVAAKQAVKIAGRNPYKFTNVIIDGLQGTYTAGAVGIIDDGVNLTGAALDGVVIRNVQADRASGTSNLIGVSVTGGGDLTIENVINRDGDGEAIVVSSAAVLTNLTIRGLKLTAASTYAVALRGTITNVRLDDIDVTCSAVTDVVYVNGTVTNLFGRAFRLEDGRRLLYADSSAAVEIVDVDGIVLDAMEAGILVHASASVTSITMRNVKGTLTSNSSLASPVLNIQGTVARATLDGLNVSTVGAVLIVGSAATSTVALSNTYVTDATWLVRADGVLTIDMLNVECDGPYYIVHSNHANGNVTVTGANLRVTSQGGGRLTLGSGAVARVNHRTFPCDVALLTPTAGDLAHNTNGASGGGAGPNVYDGTTWTRLY